jgi:hypothetical protein
VACVPFHLHPMRHDLLARGPELAAAAFDRSARDGKTWNQMLSVDACVQVFRALAEVEDVGGLRCVIANDSHLFAYCITEFWFMPGAKVLAEQFMLRVARGPSTVALDQIEAMGKDAGCRYVLMATTLAASDQALGRLFARRGYSLQSSQHLKEI